MAVVRFKRGDRNSNYCKRTGTLPAEPTTVLGVDGANGKRGGWRWGRTARQWREMIKYISAGWVDIGLRRGGFRISIFLIRFSECSLGYEVLWFLDIILSGD